ncbi:MAG TPA: Do family serine endopeptidase [Rudaea sp.]|nr:Do family serine endopeptidase [Rudaea sp.]
MYKRTLQRMLVFVALAFVSVSVWADLPDFTQLVEKNGPAVVNVRATHEGSTDMQQGNAIDPQDVPEIFRRFFGPGGPGGHPRFDGMRISMGSGFIISTDGYILTNNHVIEGADKVVVRLSDRRELDAKVVGADKPSDIALLKVDATNLPTVTIGDSSKLKPGQWVVAIGSPFDFDHSVTHGIISYVGRSSRDGSEQYVPFIQTDVPINRGNSGGPLFNLAGQVVGINSQIYSNTGSSVGISFAIPINIAMNTVEQLKSSGHVSRGMIGVHIQNMDRALAQSLGLSTPSGALVAEVTPGGGADKAGVQVRDVILAYNGHPVEQSSDLPPLVGNTKPGSTAQLKIFRDGKTLDLSVKVGELPRDGNQLASAEGGSGSAGNPLGIVVEDLTSAQRKQLGLKDQGVVITDVRGVAARRSQLQAGDVVLMVGRKSVNSASEFNAAVKHVKTGDSVMLLVRRGETTQFVAVTVPKDKG